MYHGSWDVESRFMLKFRLGTHEFHGEVLLLFMPLVQVPVGVHVPGKGGWGHLCITLLKCSIV